MTANKKIQESEHNFEANNLIYDNWVTDEGEVHQLENGVKDIPMDQLTFKETDKFVYFEDQRSPQDIRRRPRNYLETQQAPPDEGSVVIRAPSKFSWTHIVGIFLVVMNCLLGGSAYYYKQSNVNEQIMGKLDDLTAVQIKMATNMYTKQEQDLRYENIQLKLKHNEQAISHLQQNQ